MAAYARCAAGRHEDADLVHAHWLPPGLRRWRLGKPFVVQLWGTDVALARRAPRLAGVVLRRAEAVVCPSSALAGGRRSWRPAGRGRPERRRPPARDRLEARPPGPLRGRLSPEKGILELVEAAGDLNLVVAGDGPLRERVPMARGFVTSAELAALYAQAAVVACPSRREGFGVAALEVTHGRPVVAGAVGGLLDLVVNGETGILVEPNAFLRFAQPRAPARGRRAATADGRGGPQAGGRAFQLGRRHPQDARRLRAICRKEARARRLRLLGPSRDERVVAPRSATRVANA